MNTFFNTAVGSYFKTLIAVLLTLVLHQLSNGTTIFNIDWETLANGALVSFIPVVINALNPHDKRYGRKKKE